MRLKKYGEFITEKLGVPTNIIQASNELFDKIKQVLIKIQKDPNIERLNIYNETNEYITVNINGIDIKCDFTVDFIYFDKIQEYNDMDLSNEPITVLNFYFNYIKSFEDDSIKEEFIAKKFASMGCELVIHRHNTMDEIIKSIDVPKYRSSISHELKHVYDFIQKNKIAYTIFDDYINTSSLIREFQRIYPIRNFLFLLYYSHDIENTVRSTQFAFMLDFDDINNIDFYDYFKSSEQYMYIEYMKSWNYMEFKEDIEKNMEKIFDYIKYHLKDVNAVLALLYNKLNPNREIDNLNEENMKRVNKYFENMEKKLNLAADKLFRKISKLYAMTKDDKKGKFGSKESNDKINDRINKSINIDEINRDALHINLGPDSKDEGKIY